MFWKAPGAKWVHNDDRACNFSTSEKEYSRCFCWANRWAILLARNYNHALCTFYLPTPIRQEAIAKQWEFLRMLYSCDYCFSWTLIRLEVIITQWEFLSWLYSAQGDQKIL